MFHLFIVQIFVLLLLLTLKRLNIFFARIYTEGIVLKGLTCYNVMVMTRQKLLNINFVSDDLYS